MTRLTGRIPPLYTAILFIVVGAVLPYVGINRQSIIGDVCYQALCVRDYGNAPLAMLSFYVGHVWTLLFGDGLLSLRVLMVLCYQLSAAMGCLYLYNLTRRPVLSSFMFMTMAVGSQLCTMTLYGWDAGSYPFATLAMLSLLRYYRRPSLPNSVLVGIAVAVAVMSRITLLCLLLLALIVVIAAHRKSVKRIISASAAGLGAFLVTSALLAILMCGSLQGYIQSWQPDNIISGHLDIGGYLWRLKAQFGVIFTGYGIFMTAAASALAVRVMRFRYAPWAIVGGMITLTVAIAVYRVIVIDEGYDVVFGFMQPFLIMFLLLPVIYNQVYGRELDYSRGSLLIVAAVSLCMIPGSDCILERLLTIPTVPVACALTIGAFTPTVRRITGYMGVAAVVVFIYGYSRNVKRFDTDVSAYPRLEGLYDYPSAKVRLDEIVPVLGSLETTGRRPVFYGYNKQIYNYLFADTCVRRINDFHFADRDDEIRRLSEYIDGFTDIIVTQNIDGISMPELTNTENYILSRGFKKSAEGEFYKLYSRQ